MSANDDQKIREFINRLVAMSPQPPPFPEEVIVTTPKKTSRVNPILIFAGAAALVLIGAAIPILLSGGGTGPAGTTLPVVTQTTLTPGTTAPATVPPTTTPAETTTTPEVVSVPQPVVVFLVQTPDNSYTGNPALVPFATSVPSSGGSSDAMFSSLVRDALQLLTNPDLVPPPGFETSIPAGVAVLDVRMADLTSTPTLLVDMNDEFLKGAGGLLADVTMLNQLVYTATQFGAAKVLFTVNGQAIEAYGTEGIVLTDPVGREDYLDQLNSIIITEPVILGGDELPRVSGLANVFEATVSLQIVEQDGTVTFEDFTTATCGTGCWGEFTFTLDTPPLTSSSLIRVFWNSAQDGSASDVVTIPASQFEGGGWDLLPASS